MITHLVSPEALRGASLEVEGEAYRHLLRARRAAVGERWRLVDGAGNARWGELVRADRRRATVALAEAAPSHEPERTVVLVVAALRPERAGWLVEKATELGVAAIRFVASERTPRSFGPALLDRWRRLATAAVEQCHRARLPEVTGVHPWSAVADLVAPCPRRLLLEPGAGAASDLGTAAVAVIVGPEGGFTDGERSALRELGATPLGLGPRVLRVETAAIVGAAGVLAPLCYDPGPTTAKMKAQDDAAKKVTR